MEREARCQCGQLRVRTQGEPVRISVCHCLDCQRRSGSSFAAQARFASVQVEGETREWSRPGDDGGECVFSFCPQCGSTVYYRSLAEPDIVAVAVGAFADPHFPGPMRAVYESRKHGWVSISGDVERYD